MARRYDCIPQLLKTGIEYEDALVLRRVSTTLRNWYELECGTDTGAIERDETTGKPYMVNARGHRRLVTDYEKGALARLATVMAKYPTLGHYIQTDPRGASLYILRPGDVPEGRDADAYYSRGIVVCR